MSYIDLHCDTIWRLKKYRKEAEKGGKSNSGETLLENTGSIDIKGLQESHAMAQFFAHFIKLPCYGEDWENAWRGALALIAEGKEELARCAGEIKIVQNSRELSQRKENQIGAFLTLEESGVLNGDLSRVQVLYDMGIRLMTLTWNYENCIGSPNGQAGGLKSFGYQVIEEMERLGILVDVSHLSDAGFYDVLQHMKQPVVASHSNARALRDVPRNLTDDMLQKLAECGGVAGVNFYPYFLRKEGKATANDIAAHVCHMIQVAGEETPAIGTDFDGYPCGDEEIVHACQMEQVWEALRGKGLTERQIDLVCFGNALRVIETVLK